MNIFSSSINAFRQKQTHRMNNILKQYNIHVPYKPLIFIFEDNKALGSYNYDKKRILLSKKLMLKKQETIDLVLKHELAHFLSMYHYGPKIKSHGKEFKEYCQKLEVIPNAKVDIEKIDENNNTSIKEEALLNKVKKLFALGESPNQQEATAAINKANQLIEKYNLQYVESEDVIYQETIYKGKINNVKWRCIGKILEKSFQVYPVTNRIINQVFVEIHGSKQAIKIASYVASFLDKEFERLYKNAKKEFNLKGRSDKCNYFTVLTNNYLKNITPTNINNQKEGIIILDQKNYQLTQELVYKTKNTKFRNDKKKISKASVIAGRQDASKLQINQGLEQEEQKLLE